MADGYGSPGMSFSSRLPTGRMRVRAWILCDLLRWPADAPTGIGTDVLAAVAREPETFEGGLALCSPARPAAARHV